MSRARLCNRRGFLLRGVILHRPLPPSTIHPSLHFIPAYRKQRSPSTLCTIDVTVRPTEQRQVICKGLVACRLSSRFRRRWGSFSAFRQTTCESHRVSGLVVCVLRTQHVCSNFLVQSRCLKTTRAMCGPAPLASDRRRTARREACGFSLIRVCRQASDCLARPGGKRLSRVPHAANGYPPSLWSIIMDDIIVVVLM